MKIEKREIALAILFSFLTCGIYMLYWLYKVSEETRLLTNDTNGSAGMDLVLEIVTFGLYGYFVLYQCGKRMYQLELETNPQASDDSIMITIVGLFGWMIGLAILQSKINAYVGQAA